MIGIVGATVGASGSGDDAGGRAPPGSRDAAVDDYRTTLRRLALRDDAYVASVLASEATNAARSGLDGRSHALVRIAALAAMNAAAPSYMSAADAALHAGATHEEIVGTLIAVIPVVGVARVVSAAPNLGLALGYDVADALERRDDAAR